MGDAQCREGACEGRIHGGGAAMRKGNEEGGAKRAPVGAQHHRVARLHWLHRQHGIVGRVAVQVVAELEGAPELVLLRGCDCVSTCH